MQMITKYRTSAMLVYCNFPYCNGYFCRQPNLKAVLQRTQSRDSFDMNGKQQVSQISGGLVPSFIPVDQRKVASNSQLLQTYYTDCFGTDSDIRLYNPEDDGDLPGEV